MDEPKLIACPYCEHEYADVLKHMFAECSLRPEACRAREKAVFEHMQQMGVVAWEPTKEEKIRDWAGNFLLIVIILVPLLFVFAAKGCN